MIYKWILVRNDYSITIFILRVILFQRLWEEGMIYSLNFYSLNRSRMENAYNKVAFPCRASCNLHNQAHLGIFIAFGSCRIELASFKHMVHGNEILQHISIILCIPSSIILHSHTYVHPALDLPCFYQSPQLRPGGFLLSGPMLGSPLIQ